MTGVCILYLSPSDDKLNMFAMSTDICLGFLVTLCIVAQCTCKLPGMLYPRDSESRAIRHLDGMWNFLIDTSPSRADGFTQRWYAKPLSQSGHVIQIPVPSSYNDITTNKTIRDFIGWAWYDRGFFVDKAWSKQRVVLRIDSAHYNAIVWVNGKEVMQHVGGHLPFEAEVNNYLTLHGENRVTVAVNNTLTPTTLPCGYIEYKTNKDRYPPGYFVQVLQFGFFNYAGLHRHVTLYTTPQIYIEDIDIITDIQGTTGIVDYKIYQGGSFKFVHFRVSVVDKNGNTVVSGQDQNGRFMIRNAHFWWPYTMRNASEAGYLYILKVELTTGTGQSADVYRQPFGIRTVKVTNKQLFINGEPFYCHGVGKHEDSDIRGKGLDYALIARDFNMLKWLGVNCFRTSHYPYAEEIMDQADQQGIVVIDESPAIGIRKQNFGPESLAHHKQVMSEMYQRDKNRPAVIIWSLANEPSSDLPEAVPYFKNVIDHMRSLDQRRLVSFVSNRGPFNDVVVQYTDLVMINKYFGWYTDTGHTEVIERQLQYELTEWHTFFYKAVLVTEYGAETIAGFHQEPSFIFTEEYQVDFMREYHKTFDRLRSDFLVGEMVWNFADFEMPQEITSAIDNRKGLLTRQRQPKMSAHLIRDRYWSLIHSNKSYCRI